MRPERSPSSAVMTLSPSACRAWDGSHPTFPSRSSSPGVGVLLFLAGLGAGRSKLLSGALGRLGDNTVLLQKLAEKRQGGEGSLSPHHPPALTFAYSSLHSLGSFATPFQRRRSRVLV